MIVDDFLTNGAFGFPTRGHTRVIDPMVLAVVHITANLASAANQRHYANRAGSPGPSAHYYIDRDGGGVHALDEAKYAAWSNGDLKAPNTFNAGVKYLVALRRNGHNANEGCYLEVELVGEANDAGQPTDAQFDTMAGLIAEGSHATGLPITRSTVLTHADINSIDRSNCAFLAGRREASMTRLIALAQQKADGGSDVGLVTTIPATPEFGALVIPINTPALRVSDKAAYKVPASVTRPAYRLQLAGGQSEGGFGVDLNGDELHFIRGTDVPDKAFTPHTTPTDCTAQITAAVAAEHEKNRTAALDAVGKAIA